MNRIHPVFLITIRELHDQLRDWRTIGPVVGLSIVFPFIMSLASRLALSFLRQEGGMLPIDRLTPFLLLSVGIFPIIVALAVALESFVGEKERGSLEVLLYSPVRDGQLYLGKLLAAILPALLMGFIGMGIYLYVIAQSGVKLPVPEDLLHIAAVTIVQTVVMISAAVAISMHAPSVRAANLTTSFIIIPMGFLIQAEAVVLLWGDRSTLRWIIFGLIILAVLLTRMGLAHYRREEVIVHENGSLNVKRNWRLFVEALIDGAKTPQGWFFHSVSKAIRRLALPLGLSSLVILVGGWIGYQEVGKLPGLIPVTGQNNFETQINALIDSWSLFSLQPVVGVWWQNLRVLLISYLLGIFSFGVLGVLPTLFSVGVVGYLMGIAGQLGIPAGTYLVGFILPHGIFEISAAILATAAILRMGAALVSPAPGKTAGEVWLLAMADWTKVMVGVVIPLLFIAAAIEVWFTPRLALWLFR